MPALRVLFDFTSLNPHRTRDGQSTLRTALKNLSGPILLLNNALSPASSSAVFLFLGGLHLAPRRRHLSSFCPDITWLYSSCMSVTIVFPIAAFGIWSSR